MAASAAIQAVYEIGDINSLPMTAAKIYQGTAVGQVSGTDTYRALVAADKFAGFALDTFDNTGKAAGATLVQVKSSGMIVLTVTGLATTTALGASVYASADNTFTLTSTSNSLVGKVHRVESGATKAVVSFDATLV
jgi:hypothetical protein